MADRIAVMDGGKLHQFGTPDEVYRRPANISVARFIGSPGMNLITGRPVESAGKFGFQGSHVTIPLDDAMAAAARVRQGTLTLGVRPEGLSVRRDRSAASWARAASMRSSRSARTSSSM